MPVFFTFVDELKQDFGTSANVTATFLISINKINK
jgi:hypothetical protein